MSKLTRRTLLKLIAGSGLGALTMPPLSEAFAADNDVQAFFAGEGFSNLDYATIRQLAGDIIPEDQDAGAGRPEIVNQICVALLALSDANLAIVTDGISQLNELSRNVYGGNFYELPQESREQVVEAISSSRTMAAFWAHVRGTTTFIFYADPIGYLPIGLPGPNVDTSQFRLSDHETPQGKCDGFPV